MDNITNRNPEAWRRPHQRNLHVYEESEDGYEDEYEDEYEDDYEDDDEDEFEDEEEKYRNYHIKDNLRTTYNPGEDEDSEDEDEDESDYEDSGDDFEESENQTQINLDIRRKIYKYISQIPSVKNEAGRLKSKYNILKQKTYSNHALSQTLAKNTCMLDDNSGLDSILTQEDGYPEYFQDLRSINQEDYNLINMEVNQAVDRHVDKIHIANYLQLITGSNKRGWSIKRCNICRHPILTHINPWIEGCDRSKRRIPKSIKRLMFEAFKRIFIKDMKFLENHKPNENSEQKQPSAALATATVGTLSRGSCQQ